MRHTWTMLIRTFEWGDAEAKLTILWKSDVSSVLKRDEDFDSWSFCVQALMAEVADSKRSSSLLETAASLPNEVGLKQRIPRLDQTPKRASGPPMLWMGRAVTRLFKQRKERTRSEVKSLTNQVLPVKQCLFRCLNSCWAVHDGISKKPTILGLTVLFDKDNWFDLPL